jgi:hypothetical protein
MKFISTIALTLISLTAFSQDYIDYKDFTFYQNGEEISLDQVKILTKKYGVGKWKFRTATKQYRASKNLRACARKNLGHLIVLPLGWSMWDGWLYEISIGWGALGEFIESTGAILKPYGYYELASITTMKGYGRRANRRFKKTATKLNVAISKEQTLTQETASGSFGDSVK